MKCTAVALKTCVICDREIRVNIKVTASLLGMVLHMEKILQINPHSIQDVLRLMFLNAKTNTLPF